MSVQATTAPLSPQALLNRIKTVDGVGTGLDTDLVRGRAQPTDSFRLDFLQPFTPPPFAPDAAAAYIFGV